MLDMMNKLGYEGKYETDDVAFAGVSAKTAYMVARAALDQKSENPDFELTFGGLTHIIPTCNGTYHETFWGIVGIADKHGFDQGQIKQYVSMIDETQAAQKPLAFSPTDEYLTKELFYQQNPARPQQ